MRDGKLTNAAVVLFCRPRHVMLKMAIFATDARINILDMRQEQESLLKMATMAEDYVMRNLKWRFVINGPIEREEVPEIPRAVIREATMNAFCHRDYTSRLAVQVDIFGEKVEVFSPGWFPDGTSPEALLEDGARPFSQSRNQLIADALYRCKAIESYGTGLKRIKTLCADAGVDFEYETVDQGTIVRFFRPNWFEDAGGSEAIRQRGPKIPASLARIAQREELALQIAAKDGKVTTRALMDAAGVSKNTALNTLRKLCDEGKLTWRGESSKDPRQYYTVQ